MSSELIARSRTLRQAGRHVEALELALRGADQDDSPIAMHQLGVCLLDSRRFEEAEACFRRALVVDPNAAALLRGLGFALQGMGRIEEAVAAFRGAAKLAPDSAPVLAEYFQALMDAGDPQGAVECAERLIALEPGANAQIRLAQALIAASRATEAQPIAEAAQALVGSDAGAAFALAMVLQSLGRSEAESLFRRSIELSPEQGFAYSALAYGGSLTDSDMRRMRALSRAGQLPATQLEPLLFGLGRALEDRSEYPEAMRSYDQANRIARRQFGEQRFDRDLYERQIDSMIESFDGSERVEGSHGDIPIFVIGMLRSGTTLVEQILSSHPEVGGAGEQAFWLRNRYEARKLAGLRVLAESYLTRLTELWPDKRRIVDKMPDNYLEAPVIHLAFPRARFIHVLRDPADTCLSIYTTMNRLRLEWVHDKRDIAFVYRQYRKIMERWRALLPQSSMLEVSYEELVSDRERVTRQMLAFCGLDWCEDCLSPERNARAVTTPSSWQVRRGVYSSSIGRWRNFEPWIGEFVALRQS